MSHAQRKFLLGTIGTIFTGVGLCMAIDAAFIRYAQPHNTIWIWYGTGSLIVFMAGINLLLDAVYYRVKQYQDRTNDELP